MVPALLKYYIPYNSKYVHKVKGSHQGEMLGHPRREGGVDSVALFTLQANLSVLWLHSLCLSLTHFIQSFWTVSLVSDPLYFIV